MSRKIDQLSRRIEALEAQRKPRVQRAFTMVVENHMRRDEEVARFRAEHGVTNDDVLIVQVIVPFEARPGETAKEAYERELREMAGNDRHGCKTQVEALPDHGERSAVEGRTGSAMESTATGRRGDRRMTGGNGSHS
jgi:hypothetical protein